MKLHLLALFPFLFAFTPTDRCTTYWGFLAHKRINEQAMYTLPPNLMRFYKQHAVYVIKNAVAPDTRRHSDPEEAAKHFLDWENFAMESMDSLPLFAEEAQKKWSYEFLQKNGTILWNTQKTLFLLTKAFEENNVSKICFYSADLGHYIADAHVPLHTTENYNGQKTNQVGIHGLWETRLPEMFLHQYNLRTGPAQYQKRPGVAIRNALKGAQSKVDSVLSIEKELRLDNSIAQYGIVRRKNRLTLNFSDQYSQTYHNRLNGMVERQMRASIQLIGDLWLTAYINAGQPTLSSDSVALASPIAPHNKEHFLRDSIAP